MQPLAANQRETTPHLRQFKSLSQRKRGLVQSGYMAAIADHDLEQAMVYWVAEACKEARENADLGQSTIAASHAHLTGGRTGQSTIDRFEKHVNQPERIDATVFAYADELEVDPVDIWARALELWISAEKPSSEAASRAVQHVRGAARESAKSQQRSPAKPPAKRKRAA